MDTGSAPEEPNEKKDSKCYFFLLQVANKTLIVKGAVGRGVDSGGQKGQLPPLFLGQTKSKIICNLFV